MLLLGIDPSKRHTGLCLIKASTGQAMFRELKTKDVDIFTACQQLKRDFQFTLLEWIGLDDFTVGFERQISSLSAHQFYVQMQLFSVLHEWWGRHTPRIILPLPSQFRSYMRKVHAVDITRKSTTVASFRKQLNYTKRISSHCVEAYYLARMANDCYEGKWWFKTSKELPITPWQEAWREHGIKSNH